MNPKKPGHFGVGFGNKANLIDIYDYGRIQVEQIFVHPLYNVSESDTVHDIAILKLNSSLNFDSQSVSPACILQENEGGAMKYYGKVIATGNVAPVLLFLAGASCIRKQDLKETIRDTF